MEGCSAASGSVCAWYVAAGVAACCRKMKLQGFLIPVDRAFQVFCVESDMWTFVLAGGRSCARRQWMPMGRLGAPICN